MRTIIAQASEAVKGLRDTAGAAGYNQSSTDLTAILGRVISAILGLVGFIFLAFMIYGGYLWMSAGGDTAKVDKAQKIIVNSTIGLVIISAAYAITSFVFEQIIGVTGA